MANQISAEDRALLDGAQAVNDAKAAIDGKLRGVASERDSLASFWTGPAAMSFTNLVDRWSEEARKINNVLIELEANLRTTDQEQNRAEDEHQSAIQNLTGLLG